MHADMIGHEIENQAEIVLLQRLAQPLEAGIAAELRIDLGVIDDVVAVGAALARLHEGRGIEMGDAERLQIGNDGSGGVEIEIRRELQAVGGDRNGRRHQRASERQNTDQGGMRSLRLAAPDQGSRRFRRPAGRCRDPTDWRPARSVAPSPIRQLRRQQAVVGRLRRRRRPRPQAAERSRAGGSRAAPAPAPAAACPAASSRASQSSTAD